ncbi:MAG: riboflavin synthase [Alphaproteobacteria bacterium]|nr:riboflavin synthase [Alphaproteobacteria bacterium]
MFSGIITHTGRISAVQKTGDTRVTIACGLRDYRLGESIAVSGACMTVVAFDDSGFSVDVSGESLSRTAPRWSVGEAVNLERSLMLGAPLDGHLVTGHVDGLATIAAIEETGGSHVLTIDAPEELGRFIAEKGSVTLDGVSLTVNKVEGRRFWVNIIPHTWQETTLGARKAGEVLNMEIDIIARYVAKLLQK